MGQKTNPYSKAASLTKWVTWFLYVLIAASVCMGVSDLIDYLKIESLAADYADLSQAPVDSSEVWQTLVASLYFVIDVIAGVLILMWIYRANANARLLGAQDMKFTPAWAVGWYFIPIFWLWKPYQVMKEIWQTSAVPEEWQAQPVSTVVGWWWFFWIFDNVFAFRLMWSGEDAQSKLMSDLFSIAADLFNIPLCFMLIVLVNRIYQMQSYNYESVPQLSEQQVADLN